jgi:hypothetical protein
MQGELQETDIDSMTHEANSVPYFRFTKTEYSRKDGNT